MADRHDGFDEQPDAATGAPGPAPSGADAAGVPPVKKTPAKKAPAKKAVAKKAPAKKAVPAKKAPAKKAPAKKAPAEVSAAAQEAAAQAKETVETASNPVSGRALVPLSESDASRLPLAAAIAAGVLVLLAMLIARRR